MYLSLYRSTLGFYFITIYIERFSSINVHFLRGKLFCVTADFYTKYDLTF
jgi:hypothetical protein